MSNTSYSFKENSHVIVNQGGEKKVMKKILSVALSTAMAFSMFASVAFGADKLTDEQQFNALKEAGILTGYPDGQSHLEKALTRAELAKIIVKSIGLEPVTGVATYKDKNYTANHWAAPFIEAATQAGILNGKDATKKLFDPTGNVTVQELAKVLVTALKLEVPTDANNTASEWAKGYVAAAVKAGYLQEGINYQANASRSQAVVAAYAIYEAAQVPTVTKYEVKDSKNVEFTLSNGEVVKVTLEKELEANKATEVTFKTKDGVELKHTVTYVVTAATKVESVSADNLKQITVKFDGEVDKASAETKANYKINRTIDSAVLSSDARSVVLTLEGEYYSTSGNQLINQQETKITVDGVKSSDKARTLKQEVKFTPVDVTTPSVKEVVGLGTKAIKVVFSEPIDRTTASSTSNYKIDGKSIAGYVEYAFPNSVIITTESAVGDHKLTVSNVQDFSGLKVVPVENNFAVAEDKEAPTVVSTKSTDLTKVEIEFNEPLKSVGKVYNGISSKDGSVKLDRASNKITVTFTKEKALSIGENTIVIESATDYSGNSATREVKITPELDTTRPEVTSVTAEVNGSNHVLKVKFSEPVYSTGTNGNSTGAKQENYTIKDKDGKVVIGKGLNGNGHPVRAISFNNDNDEATIQLNGKLDKGTYTLEVTGVQDNAFVPNTIVPVSKTFEIGDTSEFKVSRFWVEEQQSNTGKRDVYFYVTFSKPVATEGLGSAREISKYNINWAATGTSTFEALPTDAYVDLVTPETVKITVPYTDKAIGSYTNVQLRVSLIADQDGNYAYANAGNISAAIPTNYTHIGATELNATAKDQIKVKFDGKLINVDANEFQLRSTSATTATYGLKLDSYSYDGNNTVATFTVIDGEKINPKADVKFEAKGTPAGGVVTTVNTKDAFGIAVAVNAAGVTVGDKIKPSVVKPSDAKPFVLSAGTAVTGGTQYTATVKFDEAISVVQNTGVVKVSVTGTDLESSSYAPGGANDELVITFVTKDALTADAVVSIELLAGNSDAKAITDASSNKNTADAFTLYGVVNQLR